MDGTANVKAIMARFNTGTGSPDEDCPGVRPKVPLHPTFSSGPPLQIKRQALESSLSGVFMGTSKPNFLKGSASTASAPELGTFARPKPPPGKFGTPQDEGKPVVGKQPAFKPKPPDLPRDSETKPPIPKLPVQRLSLERRGTVEGKTFPKPPPTQPKLPPAQPKLPSALAKPPLTQAKPTRSEDSAGGVALSPPKMPLAPKPKSSLVMLRAQMENGGGLPPSPPKPSSFRAAKGPEKGGSHDPPGPKLSFPPSFGRTQQDQKENSSPFTPQRKQLPNELALGGPPAKPKRPPNVNLERFRKLAEHQADNPGMKKGSSPPPLPPCTRVAPSLPCHASAPSLPPRPTAAIVSPDPDMNYDDVWVMNGPPPPPPGGHPSQNAEVRETQDSGSDEDVYEDLEETWSATEIKEQEKNREKEEKKRIELEKKEQREREKKEQEARKKFKLTGVIKVIHKVKANVDCKGSRTELPLRQGELVEILRITDNPEGRWLGRTKEGSIGYVKTESVEIDFDALKRQGESFPAPEQGDPDIYDDIVHQDDIISVKGPGVVLPPPPEEHEELYDDLEDLDLNVSDTATEQRAPPKPPGLLRMFKSLDNWRKTSTRNNEFPPPPQFTPAGSAESTERPEDLVEEEIYDDVDLQICATPPAPPTPPAPLAPPAPAAPATLGSLLPSLLQMHSKAKMEDKDQKKQKKFEKEEKEFRKKFKFDGEILVRSQVTIISPLSNKKWGSKDLPLRPGETVDVIVGPTDNKLIGRNEEGKFGYVSTSHIEDEDNGIYDDIGEECIYDND